MMSSLVERVVLLIIGSGLIALGLWPQLRAGIPDGVLFAGLSTILLAVGLRHLVAAPRLADDVAQKMADASSLRRLWLPARWYTRDVLLWQFRATSVMAITMSLMSAFVAFVVYRRGL